jgi:fructose-specific phosphotransferase system IIC component
MQNIPYQYRLLILFLLMGLAVGVDYWRHPTRPTKLREYRFLIVAGLIGAAFGIVNDQITCTLSPAYFYYFKDIPYNSSFRWQVSRVGFEAGFFAGFLTYGTFLLVNQRRKIPFSYSQLLKMALYPIAWAILFAPITGLAFHAFHFSFFVDQITPVLQSKEVSRFMLVWGIHIGLYIGAVLGIAHGSVNIYYNR